jgi:hypothetical protein
MLAIYGCEFSILILISTFHSSSWSLMSTAGITSAVGLLAEDRGETQL